MSLATSTSKEILYIDIDDEITAIIEKVTSSQHKIVALVLPKRSTTLQSIVNMKLLQRSATAAKKNLVLITSDQNLLPLAGAVGIHVAKTPQSKPVIPADPTSAVGYDEDAGGEAIDEDDFDVNAKGAVAIGALAATQNSEDETIELDNTPVSDALVEKTKSKKSDKKGGPKVPNFNKFRSWLGVGIVAGIVLLVGAIFAFFTMPKATVIISTNTKEVANTLDVQFDATAKAVTVTPPVVPSVVERVDRTNSETVAATGERNDGVKATGTVILTLCASTLSDVKSVPAGTGTSTAGKNYITQKTAPFDFAKKQTCTGGKFTFTSENVPIVSQAGGTGYNVTDATFTVAGSTATGTGSASGGTDDIKKIVAQADIDSATKKLEAKTDTTIQDELSRRLESKNLYVIEDSYTTTSSSITSSVNAGAEAADVTVTRKTANTMIGTKEADLNELITKTVEKQIDPARQKVLNTGLTTAVFKMQNQQDNSTKVLMSMSVKSTVGPQLDDEKIKEDVAGMKAAEAEALIGSYPGVSKVEVTYGPFWVSSIPKNTDKITIIHEK